MIHMDVRSPHQPIVTQWRSKQVSDPYGGHSKQNYQKTKHEVLGQHVVTLNSAPEENLVNFLLIAQMNVSITDRLAGYVRKKVKSGRYNNASEVVREALRRMEDDEARAVRLARPTVEDILSDLGGTQ
jgi:putative addiction module CopG family antidote